VFLATDFDCLRQEVLGIFKKFSWIIELDKIDWTAPGRLISSLASGVRDGLGPDRVSLPPKANLIPLSDAPKHFMWVHLSTKSTTLQLNREPCTCRSSVQFNNEDFFHLIQTEELDNVQTGYLQQRTCSRISVYNIIFFIQV